MRNFHMLILEGMENTGKIGAAVSGCKYTIRHKNTFFAKIIHSNNSTRKEICRKGLGNNDKLFVLSFGLVRSDTMLVNSKHHNRDEENFEEPERKKSSKGDLNVVLHTPGGDFPSSNDSDSLFGKVFGRNDKYVVCFFSLVWGNFGGNKHRNETLEIGNSSGIGTHTVLVSLSFASPIVIPYSPEHELRILGTHRKVHRRRRRELLYWLGTNWDMEVVSIRSSMRHWQWFLAFSQPYLGEQSHTSEKQKIICFCIYIKAPSRKTLGWHGEFSKQALLAVRSGFQWCEERFQRS